MTATMRILFFTHYYPPEVNAPASRTAEHCRAWAKRGHDVSVVTCVPNHPAGRVYPGYRNRLWQSETIDGVRVHRVLTFLAANAGFVRRSLNFISYYIAATLAALVLRRTDVIVTTSPHLLCGLVGLPARWLARAPWVLEIRDLWPESLLAVGLVRSGRASRALEALEAHAYRKADGIVSVTKSFVPHIERLGGTGKVSIVRNGVDFSLFSRDVDAKAIRQRFDLEDRFVVGYVGTLGMAHGLDTLLDVADALRSDTRFGFLLVGDGAERERLTARVRDMGLDNIRIVGQLPKEDMPAVWAATDVAVILLRRSAAFEKVLPSKMFEAMAMGRPIILGVNGESRALLDEAKAGIAITPDDAIELATAIKAIADDPARAAEFGRNGYAFARANLDRETAASNLLKVLQRVAAGHAWPGR